MHGLSVYIHNFLLLSHKKKNEIQPFAETWINLEDIILSEISQSKRQILYTTYMWNLKINKLMYLAKQKQTLHR